MIFIPAPPGQTSGGIQIIGLRDISFVRLLQTCRDVVLKENEPILMHIGARVCGTRGQN